MRSSCARLTFINSANRFLDSFLFFISVARWCAMTDLMAATVTSSRMPASSGQLSRLDPICGFLFLVMMTFLQSLPHGRQILRCGFLFLDVKARR
jgi:hypothetical protein